MSSEYQKVYIAIGLPGSGKSTYAKYLAFSDLDLKIVNKDAIRTMLHGTYVFNVLTEPMVHECMKSIVKTILSAGYDLFIDECNVTIAERKELVALCRAVVPYANITYVEFLTSAEMCKQRKTTCNYGYDPAIWVHVVDKLAGLFQPPSVDEGADSVRVISG